MLINSNKTVITDQRFDSDESNTHFSNHVFVRLVAMGRTFTKVNFRYTFFDDCYLRNCQFDSCDFTGCRFVNTQLPGAKFSGCKFDYATFEKTLIDARVLDTECPGLENLKMRFARSLRINFQQLGDADAVNKAMRVELTATEIHLKKAWQSNESYYRSHHPGSILRTLAFLEWLKFKSLDFIWGNGENLLRLVRFVLIVIVLMAVGDVASGGDPGRLQSYVASFIRSFAIFFGTLMPDDYGKAYLALITCLRLVTVGFFLSIIIKKFSRR
jgi:Pentapeptide repeats (9 copies)